jgi:hypothetical protein
VGYRAFLAAARTAVAAMLLAALLQLPISSALSSACWELIADACDPMLLPRSVSTIVASESSFAQRMQVLMKYGFVVPQDAVGTRLLATWRRVERSGLLRFIDRCDELGKDLHEFLGCTAAAAAAAPGLRPCALASCGAREKHRSGAAHFKSCAACRGVAYCCKEHQTADWPSHKTACKAARKGKAADGAGGPSG